MIIIQCAMEMEAQPFLATLGDAPRTETIANQRFHFGPSFAVAITGIGLANAAAGTARALQLVPEAELVIAAGTCGGLHTGIEVGDIAVATNAIYSMADATAFGYEPGQVPGMPASYDALTIPTLDMPHMTGRVISADAFITASNVDAARGRFPETIATDMETAAMAQTCFAAEVPWVSLRAVSDLCGPAAGQDFHMDGALAAQRSFDAVTSFLETTGRI
ncbi:5'-methylthioadenosine/S-adenosylhomocysteine nucleosidase [Corynebacterium kalinowskii]|uniref:adenosylhomocysteine nucleosidase n=1 Tax=Corynebacterium kalinowskii TaxID=2675216 RepID=A0A6B8VUC2_9CORY|nr:5'-methylthioadenosine/S-adenosylhomocysteine nucleosidase [Corynebacterium kalinowskii]QGU03237.1 5'-methylthioadenosine/S-adenosylhomocysteine nucleosidase [Corynebacterium kalinowskii]